MSEISVEEIVKQLSAAGVSSPRLEARLLYAAAADDKMLRQMLEERLAHKPLDKILGHREFYKYDFKVSTDVLSPRPDTETLVEEAVKIIKQHNVKNILELGVGSGCVLLSLLADFKELKGTGVDISEAALAVASQNAKDLNVIDRCRFLQADWNSTDFGKQINNTFDMIISNPPYIPTKDIKTLEADVRVYDPLLALDGGKDGLDAYRRIAALAPCLLKENGCLILEAGISQAEDIVALVCAQGLAYVQTVKDLSGIERCIIFQKKDCNL